MNPGLAVEVMIVAHGMLMSSSGDKLRNLGRRPGPVAAIHGQASFSAKVFKPEIARATLKLRPPPTMIAANLSAPSTFVRRGPPELAGWVSQSVSQSGLRSDRRR